MLLTIESLDGNPWPQSLHLEPGQAKSHALPNAELDILRSGRQLVLILQTPDPILLSPNAKPAFANSLQAPRALLASQQCGLAMADALLALANTLEAEQAPAGWRIHAYQVGTAFPGLQLHADLGMLSIADAQNRDYLREAHASLPTLLHQTACILAMLDEGSFIDPALPQIALTIHENQAWLGHSFTETDIHNAYQRCAAGNARGAYDAISQVQDQPDGLQPAWETFQAQLAANGFPSLEGRLLEEVFERFKPEQVADIFNSPAPAVMGLPMQTYTRTVHFHHFDRESLAKAVPALQGLGMGNDEIQKIALTVLPSHYHLDSPARHDLVLCRAEWLRLPNTFRRQTLDELLGNWRPKHLVWLLPDTDGQAAAFPIPNQEAFTALAKQLGGEYAYQVEFECRPAESPRAWGMMAAIFTAGAENV